MPSQFLKVITLAAAAAVAHQPRSAADALSFSNITEVAGLGGQPSGSHGAMFADADGDGLTDLYITFNLTREGFRANRFYRNSGGVFTEEAGARGIDNFSAGSHGAAWADLDNDGDFDLVVGNTYGSLGDLPSPAANRVLRNDGGRFVDVTPADMAGYADYTRGITALDANRDGFLDIFAVNGYLGNGEPIPDRNELYLNRGGLIFTAITSGAAITAPAGQGVIDTDFDGDGDVDLIAPNQEGALAVLRNDGGVFSAVPPQAVGIAHRAATGISSGDLDNDGDLDLILVDDGGSGLRVGHIYVNNGNGSFTYAGDTPRFPGYTAGLADLDNDGDLDLVLPGYPVVYLNNGAGAFVAGPALPGPGGDEDPRTVAFADIDQDGDLDFAITTKLGVAHLFRNNRNEGSWLKVRLVSPQGEAGAFGSKVSVFRAGTRSLIGMREARSSGGYLAQDDPVLHVGLGTAASVDVEVVFVDGTRITRSGVSANQTLVIDARSSVEFPQTPTNLVASVAGTVVTLTWNAPAGGGAPAQYVIEAGSSSGAMNLATMPTAGAATSFSAMAPPGTYYVRVKARNAAGTSAASNEVVVIVGGGGRTVPAAPVGLTFTRTGSVVSLQWSPPTQGGAPDSYLVEAGSIPGASNLAMFDVGLTTTITATAAPGTYFVRVRARNTGGVGPASNEAVIQVSDRP
jgi:hypothetical protein